MSKNNQPIDVNLLKSKILEMFNDWCGYDIILRYSEFSEFSEEDMPPNMVSFNNADGSVMIEFPDVWDDRRFSITFDFISESPLIDGGIVYDVLTVKVLDAGDTKVMEFFVAQSSRYSSWGYSEAYSVFEVEQIRGPITIQLPNSGFRYTETLSNGTEVECLILEDLENRPLRISEDGAKIVSC